jgi:alcohol dehydrogenase
MGWEIAVLPDMEAAKKTADGIRRLIKDIKIPSLPALGVEEGKLKQLAPQMAEDAITSGSPGNSPRQAKRDKIIP